MGHADDSFQAQMSFKLRDLLLGAPIYQAALNQEELHELEGAASSASSSSAAGLGLARQAGQFDDAIDTERLAIDEGAYTDDLDTDASESANEVHYNSEDDDNDEQDDQSGADGGIISASECRARLQAAMSGGGAAADDSARLEYEMSDLLNGRARLGRLAIDADLELLVNPSGVRVVRLEELATSRAK